MKRKRIVWMSTLLLLLGVAGCEKETGTSTDQRQIGDVVEVFELAYGQSKEITYGGKEKFTLSLQDIKDHVTVNCALADFKSREEYASEERRTPIFIVACVLFGDKETTIQG